MTESTNRNRWLAPFAAGLLLIVHAWLALSAVRTKNITVDEIFHVTGGFLYNTYGDYRIHTDNGVLPQRWHALPTLFFEAKPPPVEHNEYWTDADVAHVSHQFFYEVGNDHWPILMRARMMNVCWSLATCLLVFCWARSLAGDAAGIVALSLAALSPTLLAHGPLATSDMCAAFLLLASVGTFWWQLRGGNGGRTVISAIVFGLACISKYSAVLLLPAFLLLTAIHYFTQPKTGRGLRGPLVEIAAHGVMAILIIWTAFGFRYTTFAPGLSPSDYFVQRWEFMIGRMGWQSTVIDLCRRWHLLPEGFLFGYTHTYIGAQSRGAFLAGEYHTTGWARFFPLAFYWKSTLPELAGLIVGLLAVRRHWGNLKSWALRIAPLLVWTAIYGGAAVASHLNIGHRHLLPLYPVLFIGTGVALMRFSTKATNRIALAWAFFIGEAATVFAIHPDYLAYFNPLAGGPANGYHLLVDSSLDWGQDLSGLGRWLDTQPKLATGENQTFYLSYFGSGEPDYYKLGVTRLPFTNGFSAPHPYYEPKGGIYAISATMLQNVYAPTGHDYTIELEREYQSLRPLSPLFRAYWQNPELRPEIFKSTSEAQFLKAWGRFDWLRFARLTAFLRARQPDAMVGYSIMIYRLSDGNIDRVLNRSYSDWAAAIAEAERR